jgi:hypothetical protein
MLLSPVLAIYLAVLALYRLYWSPIAHSPGPRLGALTGWYETFSDVVHGGQFTFQIEKIHQQYGKSEYLPHKTQSFKASIQDPSFVSAQGKFTFKTPTSTISCIQRQPDTGSPRTGVSGLGW